MTDKEPTAEELEAAAREANREYHKEWQHKHPEKVKEYHRRYWEKKGAEILAKRASGKDH